MRITAQEEYGLRCLLQIAREARRFLTIPEIAAREKLTAAYVAKLMRLLRKGGLVRSIRGQKGGYRLARAPDEITVDSVLAALGGPIYSREFCEDHAGNLGICVHDSDCTVRSLWMGLDRAVHGVLGRTTLRDLLAPRCAAETLVPLSKLS
jgi:Rrf2 family protein